MGRFGFALIIIAAVFLISQNMVKQQALALALSERDKTPTLLGANRQFVEQHKQCAGGEC